MEKDFPIFRNYLEEEDDKPYFTMNSIAYYYEDMERKQKLIEELAKQIFGYDKKLNLNLSEIEQRVAERFTEWDQNLETFPDNVTELLSQWVDNGTMDHVIDTTLLEKKAEQSEVNQLTEKINTLANKTKGKVNVQEYSHLVVNNDWTTAIQTALNSLPTGGTLFFPEGTYLHTGITIPARYLNVEGSGRYATFLKNTSSNNAITIVSNSERGTFRNIGIMGNGSLLYGSDATSGHGIVFGNNTVSWTFDNVTVRGHGGCGFQGGFNGHVNNINIMNSEIEFNKGSGINFVAHAGKSQINAINVNGCNISNNGGSGLELWGNSINISENTLQGNRKYGYDINSDLVAGTGTLSCDAINIYNNYSEKNLLGLLNVKVDKITSPLTYKYIGTLIFEGNYGTENSLDPTVTSLIMIKKGMGLSGIFDRAIKVFKYAKNSLSAPSPVSILDAGNLIHGDSEISTSGPEAVTRYTNLGLAKFIVKRKTITLNSFLTAKGVNFPSILNGKSDPITANTSIFYPVNMEDYNGIHEVGIPVETDFPNARIDFIFHGRKTSLKVDYTPLQSFISLPGASGMAKVLADSFKPFTGYSDIYLEIKIYPGTGGTFLHVYNPFITFG